MAASYGQSDHQGAYIVTQKKLATMQSGSVQNQEIHQVLTTIVERPKIKDQHKTFGQTSRFSVNWKKNCQVYGLDYLSLIICGALALIIFVQKPVARSTQTLQVLAQGSKE